MSAAVTTTTGAEALDQPRALSGGADRASAAGSMRNPACSGV